MAQISIIIPVYNSERYLSSCLDSVLAQTFEDWEAICINDGSTDGSGEILDRHAVRDSRIRVFTQKNRGPLAARNCGIEAAQGEWIFPLDSDDRIEPSCLEKLYNARRHGDVIYPLTRYAGARSGISLYARSTRLSMSRANCLSVSALFRKRDWERYGGYDTVMNKGPEDWEFGMNVIGEWKNLYCVQEPLFVCSVRDNSSSSVAQLMTRELMKAICSKNPFMCRYRALSSLLRFFFVRQGKGPVEACVRFFRIPVYRKMTIRKGEAYA